MQIKTVAIVGASHSGISAAINIKKALKDDVNVILFEQNTEEGLSFVGADGLLWVEGIIDDSHLGYTTSEKIRSSGIDFYLSTKVSNIDSEQQIIGTNNGEFKYDYVILATGSSPIIPGFAKDSIINNSQKSADGFNRVQSFKTIYDAYNLKKMANDDNVKKVAVIGGGYIGVEVAMVIKNLQKDVVIINRSDRILNSYFDETFSNDAEQILLKNGIEIAKNIDAISIDQVCNDYNTDGVIISVGFTPNTDINMSSKNEIEQDQKTGAYLVDKCQETSIKNVFAIGDCASTFHNVLNKHVCFAIGSRTRIESTIVSDQITSRIKNLKPNLVNTGTQGSTAISVYGVNIASTGLTFESALANQSELDIEPKQVFFEGPEVATYLEDYLPNVKFLDQDNSEPKSLIKISLVYDDKTHRILGAQILTKTGATSLIHMFSLAIYQKLTLFDLQTLDMFFLPQLNQLYNSVSRVISRSNNG